MHPDPTPLINLLPPIIAATICFLLIPVIAIKFNLITIKSNKNTLKPARSGATPFVPYEEIPLFSKWERNFRNELHRSLPAHLVAYPQTSYGAFLSARSESDPDKRKAANRKITTKRADFIIYNLKTEKVVLVYELNDRTHERPDRKERDSFIKSALLSARIDLITVKPFEKRDFTKDLARHT